MHHGAPIAQDTSRGFQGQQLFNERRTLGPEQLQVAWVWRCNDLLAENRILLLEPLRLGSLESLDAYMVDLHPHKSTAKHPFWPWGMRCKGLILRASHPYQYSSVNQKSQRNPQGHVHEYVYIIIYIYQYMCVCVYVYMLLQKSCCFSMMRVV